MAPIWPHDHVHHSVNEYFIGVHDHVHHSERLVAHLVRTVKMAVASMVGWMAIGRWQTDVKTSANAKLWCPLNVGWSLALTAMG